MRLILENKCEMITALPKRQLFSPVYLKAAPCFYRKALNPAAGFLSLPPIFLRAATGEPSSAGVGSRLGSVEQLERSRLGWVGLWCSAG